MFCFPALKSDRKRLKGEKFDLISQVKHLYASLDDKDKELRDFVCNYEHKIKVSFHTVLWLRVVYKNCINVGGEERQKKYETDKNGARWIIKQCCRQ